MYFLDIFHSFYFNRIIIYSLFKRLKARMKENGTHPIVCDLKGILQTGFFGNRPTISQ